MARVKVPIAVIDPAGNAVAGASVRVKKRADGSDAVLYVAETGPTTTSNPIATDTYGRVTAWVDRGAYNATISGTGITTYTEPFEAGPAGARGIDEPWLPEGALPVAVAVLPSSPADGQEVYYVADASSGVIWHLRYRAASADTYKWEYLGGPEMFSEVIAQEAKAVGAYSALTTPGPSATLPLAGDYDVEIGSFMYSAANSSLGYMSYSVNGAVASDGDSILMAQPAGSNSVIAYSARARRRRFATAGTTLVAQYRAATGAVSFQDRWMRVRPVRVG